MEMFLFLAALLIPLGLNIKATMLVARDPLSESTQKTVQLLMVWLLPILGALVVIVVHRPQEKPARKYREETDAGDDFGSGGASLRSIGEALDGD